MIKRSPDPRGGEISPAGKQGELDKDKISETPGAAPTRPIGRSALSETSVSIPIIVLTDKNLPPGSPGKLTLSQTSARIPVVIPPGKKQTTPASPGKPMLSETSARMPVVIPPEKKKQPSPLSKPKNGEPAAISHLKDLPRLHQLKRHFIWYLVTFAGILSIILSFIVTVPLNNGQQGGNTLIQGIITNRQNGNITSHPQGQPQGQGQGQGQPQGQGQGQGQGDGSGQTPVGQSGNWKTVFNDEFNGSALDRAKWTTCYFNGQHSGSDCNHGEDNWFTPHNVIVNNGILTLQGRKNSDGYNYSSGMIESGPTGDAPFNGNGGFAFTYGYVEMRAQIPTGGNGIWPGFWLMPNNGSWDVETDIFEFINGATNEDQIHYHVGGANSVYANVYNPGINFSSGYHVYGLDWEPGSLTFYVDGVRAGQYSGGDVYGKPMYIINDLAIGGPWPQPPDAGTPFPANFQISYIRVWQH